MQTFNDVEKSIYQFQKDHTREYIEDQKLNAFRYFKRNISYRETDRQIENIAKLLHAKNVKPGDVVAIISPMLPEVITSVYGINKNGATAFCIDPRNNATRIRDFLNLTDVKTVIMFDQVFGKLDAIIDQTKIENVFVVKPTDSMFSLLGLSYQFSQANKTNQYYQAIRHLKTDSPAEVAKQLDEYTKKKALTKEDKKVIKDLKIYQQMRDIALKNLYYTTSSKEGYADLSIVLNQAKKLPDFVPVYYPDIPATLTLTSGTTGNPKLVPTMNRSFNVKVRDYTCTTMPIVAGDRMLSMPPFILYGTTYALMAYARGVTTITVPDITAYYYPDVIRKEKISHAVGVPSQALTLAEDKEKYQETKEKLIENMRQTSSKKAKKKIEKQLHKMKPWEEEFKDLKTISVGGTRMLVEHEQKINEALHSLKVAVTQGYSMTELTPASMTNTPGFIKEGSVGRVIGNTKCLIVNEETLEQLPVGTQGILLVHSETQFKGYYKNEEATKNVFVDIDGLTYVNTGDQAYMDEDGYYYIVGRKKEMIIRPDGHNNFPSEMENIIAQHPAVANCAVVGVKYPDYENPTGEYPKAHVVLKEKYKGNEVMIEEQLKSYCLEQLPERDVPYFYQFHDELPLTPVLKPDKLALQAADKELFLKEFKGKQKVLK